MCFCSLRAQFHVFTQAAFSHFEWLWNQQEQTRRDILSGIFSVTFRCGIEIEGGGYRLYLKHKTFMFIIFVWTGLCLGHSHVYLLSLLFRSLKPTVFWPVKFSLVWGFLIGWRALTLSSPIVHLLHVHSEGCRPLTGRSKGPPPFFEASK